MGGYSYLNSDVYLLWISDSSKLGVSDNTMLVVADSSKLGEEIGCKEYASIGTYEWGVEGSTDVLYQKLMYTMTSIFQSATLNELLK